MKLIAAVDHNWAIGKDEKLLVRLPEDMKHFRKMTEHHVIVMGRKTLESFPNKKPLPNRTNIVVTTQTDYHADDAIIVHSKQELLKIIANYKTDNIYIIGGESIYNMMLDDCDTAYITYTRNTYEADTWFPNLDIHPDWQLQEQSFRHIEDDIIYCFKTYRKTGGN